MQYRVYWLDEATEEQGVGPICMSREAAVRWARQQPAARSRFTLSEIHIGWVEDLDRMLGKYGSFLEWVEIGKGTIRVQIADYE